jgi:hypothetical protein
MVLAHFATLVPNSMLDEV